MTISRFIANSNPPITLSKEFVEVESGKSHTNRPRLLESLALCKKTGATLVIATLSRLSRNASFLLSLQDSGVEFIALDALGFDRFSIGILALIAQKEREDISGRTKTALAALKARGNVKLGNPDPGPSLKRAREAYQTQKRAFAAQAYEAIKEIQSTGIHSLNRIASYMNKRGEKTTRDGAWTSTTVKRILMTVQETLNPT